MKTSIDEKRWRERLLDANRYVVVNQDNRAVMHCLSKEEFFEWRKHFAKNHQSVRLYKEVTEEEMSTVDKTTADRVIAGDGMYPGDYIRVTRIYQYKNAFDGRPAYKLMYDNKAQTLEPSDFIIEPTIYWEYKK